MPTLTPADLSLELGVPQKRIRDVLREFFGTLDIGTTRWELSDEQADAVRDRFRAFDLVPGDKLLRRQVHARFGGDWRRGISTPANRRNIFVFTDPVQGPKYGYDVHEGLTPEGNFLYTGEGPKGHQDLNHANRALRDSEKNGIPVRLFAVDGTAVTYVGTFVPDSPAYCSREVPDAQGVLRQALIFSLLPVEANLELVGPTGELLPPLEILDWRPPDFSEVSLTDVVREDLRTVSRVEFELQHAFGQWLIAGGTPPQTMKLRTGHVLLQPDLYVPSRGWIVEAKKSTARSHVRTAIGQVLDYVMLARSCNLEVVPVLLLPGRLPDDLRKLVGSLSIVTVSKTTTGFEIIE
jgi:hypothetical protein